MKNYIIVATIAFITGAVGVKFLFPTIKEKTVEVEKEVVRKDIVTEIREVIKKDGTKEIVTVIVDKSKEQKESSKTQIISKDEWHISVAALTPNTKDIFYQVQVERRIIGDIHLGVLANTNNQYGISLGMSF